MREGEFTQRGGREGGGRPVGIGGCPTYFDVSHTLDIRSL